MSLEQQVMADLKTAMLAKDEKGLRGLRAIKAAIIIAKTSEGSGGEIKPEDETKLLQKLIKQRKDSLEIFEQQNRADLDVPAPAPAPAGGHVWRITLESEKLGLDRGSQAFATIAPGGRLAAIRFRLLGFGMTAAGEIALQGCEGEA